MVLAYRRREAVPTRQQIVKVHTVPAPVGGLNARDSIAAMPETDALTLENYFPQPSYISVRSGYVQWATGLPAWVETMMDYRSATAHKIFSISNTAVYDTTNSGAVGAAVVTGLTNARWEWTNVATPGGQFIYAANATDAPLLYDGTTWTKVTGVSSPAITGVTTTLLRNPTVWKNRVWFIENNTNHVWYLPTQSIGGAASKLDFSELYRLGGSVQAIITCSLNDGSTFDEFIGFLSTEGELLLYQGTDPDFSSTFALRGIYRFGRPIGRRCWFRVGSDAVIICSDGFLPVSKVVESGNTGANQTISYKILALVNADVQSFSGNFGWEGQLFPLGNKIIINVPSSENSVQYQYVMNTIHGAWGKFTNWNAATFLVSRDTLYFGTNGMTCQADTGNTDAGANILGTVQPAFSYMGYQGEKRFTMVRPLFQSAGIPDPAVAMNVDFKSVQPTQAPAFTPAVGSPWNTSPWNTSPWAAGAAIRKDWQTAPGIGYAGTLYMQTTSSQQTNLLSIDYAVEQGGVL